MGLEEVTRDPNVTFWLPMAGICIGAMIGGILVGGYLKRKEDRGALRTFAAYLGVQPANIDATRVAEVMQIARGTAEVDARHPLFAEAAEIRGLSKQDAMAHLVHDPDVLSYVKA
jgi:hypothetical protein